MADSKFSLLALTAGALMLLPAAAMADGRVSITRGNTTLAHAGQVSTAERGAQFTVGDRVSTAGNGGMQLWLEDDSVIVLGESTHLQFDAYRPDAKTLELSSSGGALRMVSGTFQPTVQTGIAAVTAMGTDFTVVLCAGQCGRSPSGLYVKVDAGRVRAQNAAGTVEAGAGEFIFVAAASTAPRLAEPPSTGELPILMASLDIDLELLNLDIELVVLPTLPDLPVDPSPSNAP